MLIDEAGIMVASVDGATASSSAPPGMIIFLFVEDFLLFKVFLGH